MRLVFLGTSEFAVPCLRALVREGHDIPLVVTQPDRPAGRGYRLAPSPVKRAAGELALPLVQPERVAEAGFVDALRGLAPEACVVVAFGQKITPELLRLGTVGWLNVHGSLLPRWRGAAPVARAIMAGDAVSGVTTMYLDAGWDTGDIILKRETPIGPDENAGELAERLAGLGGELLVETLRLISAGQAPRVAQDEREATVAPRLRPEEGELDWSLSAPEVHNRVRGLTPAPGAHTRLRGKRLKVLQTRLPEPGEIRPEWTGAVPGTIRLGERAALYVTTGAGLVRLVAVQAEGSRPLAAEEFARGQRLSAGERLGEV